MLALVPIREITIISYNEKPLRDGKNLAGTGGPMSFYDYTCLISHGLRRLCFKPSSAVRQSNRPAIMSVLSLAWWNHRRLSGHDGAFDPQSDSLPEYVLKRCCRLLAYHHLNRCFLTYFRTFFLSLSLFRSIVKKFVTKK